MRLNNMQWSIDTVINDPESVDAAIGSRASVRAFLDQPVPKELIREIIQLALLAPSGANIQPWKVYVVQGEVRNRIVDAVCKEHDKEFDNPPKDRKLEYEYYPKEWFTPYIERRRENGWGLYKTLKIERGEKEKMHKQHQENFRFFNAPVGLLFTIDKRLGRGSLIDYGMFMQTLMIAARARGLHSCTQAAWIYHSDIIKPLIAAPDNEMIVCGISLGYADTQALVNKFRADREPVDQFITWLG